MMHLTTTTPSVLHLAGALVLAGGTAWSQTQSDGAPPSTRTARECQLVVAHQRAECEHLRYTVNVAILQAAQGTRHGLAEAARLCNGIRLEITALRTETARPQRVGSTAGTSPWQADVVGPPLPDLERADEVCAALVALDQGRPGPLSPEAGAYVVHTPFQRVSARAAMERAAHALLGAHARTTTETPAPAPTTPSTRSRRAPQGSVLLGFGATLVGDVWRRVHRENATLQLDVSLPAGPVELVPRLTLMGGWSSIQFNNVEAPQLAGALAFTLGVGVPVTLSAFRLVAGPELGGMLLARQVSRQDLPFTVIERQVVGSLLLGAFVRGSWSPWPSSRWSFTAEAAGDYALLFAVDGLPAHDVETRFLVGVSRAL